MFHSSRLGIAVVTTIVLAACGSERPRARELAPERTLTTAQDLSASNLFGSSLPAKTLAFTFDDGPGDRAAELSSYLAGQGIRATFFVNGGHIAATTLPNPNGLSPSANAAQVLAQIAADGHLVANHTTTHRDLVSEVLPTGTAKVVQELAETDVDIAAYVPSNHFLFRAPYGSYDQNVWAALAPSAMNKYVGPIFWEVGGSASNYPSGAADWACWQEKLQSGGGAYFGATTKDCGDAYLNEIYAVGRGVVLMHDPYSSALGNTVDMVKYIVPILKAKGYAFARVDEIPAIAALLPADSCDASCASCTQAGLCASCRGGAYLSGGACDACSTCAPGTCETAACTASSNTSCATCAPGTFTATWGAHSCAACDPGAFAARSGAQSCTMCEPGTFAATAGATSCAACPPGTSAVAPGATECIADPPPPPPPPPPPVDAGADAATDAGTDAATSPSDGGRDATPEATPDAAVTPDGGDVDPGLVSADAAAPDTDRPHGNGAAGDDGGGCTIGRSSPQRGEGNLAIALGVLGLALIRSRQRS